MHREKPRSSGFGGRFGYFAAAEAAVLVYLTQYISASKVTTKESHINTPFPSLDTLIIRLIPP